MADVQIADASNSGHLVIDVDVEAPRLEPDDDQAVQDIGVEVETTIGAGAPNKAGAEAVTTTGDGDGDGVVSATGAYSINTAGAGSVTVSGGMAAGGINTSGAGSVITYKPAAAKGINVEEDHTKKIPWTVGVIGGLTQATAAAAVFCRSPGAHGGGEVAFLVGIASVFVAGLAEIVAAFWVSIDTQKRGDTGKKIICLSVLMLLLAIALVGVAIVPKIKM